MATLERKPLKSQFVLTFIMILVISLLATMATYGIGYMVYVNIEYKKVYPANYYEQQVPKIIEYINLEGEKLFDKDAELKLNKVVPSEGMQFQVVDGSGSWVYGTDTQKLIEDKEDLLQKLNTTFGKDGRHVKTIPIVDDEGRIRGAVLLSYTLTIHYQTPLNKLLLVPFFLVILLSPFLYIILFTWLFSKRLTDNIEKPVKLIIDASAKVKEKDLDFEIDYHADNELGRLCEAFNEMKNELRVSLISQWKAEQERQEMVQALAHDLKTPLSVIQGYAEALLDGYDTDAEKTKKYLQVIKDNALKSTKLTQEMLYAAEIEMSKPGLSIAPVDICSFLMQKKEAYEIMAKDKNINFVVDVVSESQSETVCPIDAVKLERILDNIVSNSIRYTPENGTITIKVEMKNDKMVFKIADTGKGFSPHEMTNLFNKFYRGDQARSTRDGHAGLGLYIAKKLVQMYGGSIKASNAEEGGAVIRFDIQFTE